MSHRVVLGATKTSTDKLVALMTEFNTAIEDRYRYWRTMKQYINDVQQQTSHQLQN